MITIILLVGMILSAILYRLGGAGKTGDCFDFARRSWVRDWLIPPVMLTCLALTTQFHLIYIYVYLLVWGLMGAALSTYYDPIFKYDSMYAHGFGIGLSTLPLIFAGVHWYSITIYMVALSLFMGLISHKTKLVPKWKELIRGALIVTLLPLLFI